MGQDNESYRNRVSKAVMDAVIEAGRDHPGAADVRVDVNEVLDAMCDAMATFAASVGQIPEDREQGAQMLGLMEERIVTQLRFFADKLRSGELSRNPPVRPRPRLVE